MVVTYKDDVTTLDPAIGYDWQNWSIIKSLFDGLMDYKPGTTELVPDLAESYEISPDGQDLHLQAAPRGQVPQRPRADRRGHQVLDRARCSTPPRRARAPASSARSPASRRPTRTRSCSSCRGPTPPSCTSWRSTSPMPCPRRRSRSTAPISARTRSAPAPSSSPSGRSGQRLVLERNPDYWKAGRAQARPDHLRGRPGAAGGAAAPAARRGRHPGRRHPARQVPGGQEQPRMGRQHRDRRAAPHRLRDDERQRAAVRQEGGAPGGQPRDQQGPHRPDHQQPRGAGEPAAAALDAGLRQGLRRATPTIRPRPRSCCRRLASATASRPCSTPPTPTPTRASPRRSSRISRPSASRPSCARWPRPT